MRATVSSWPTWSSSPSGPQTVASFCAPSKCARLSASGGWCAGWRAAADDAAAHRGAGASALRGLRHDPDVGLRRLPLAEDLLGLVVGDRARDDHVLALLPVHRRGDLVLGGELERVDDAQHLVEVAARRHGIDEDQLDLLVRPDDEDVADGLVVGGRAPTR